MFAARQIAAKWKAVVEGLRLLRFRRRKWGIVGGFLKDFPKHKYRTIRAWWAGFGNELKRIKARGRAVNRDPLVAQRPVPDAEPDAEPELESREAQPVAPVQINIANLNVNVVNNAEPSSSSSSAYGSQPDGSTAPHGRWGRGRGRGR